MKFGIGQSVSRVEDPRLLRGDGKYVDDVTLPGQLYGMVFRSPYAHARVSNLDVASASALPGVIAVYTAADAAIAGLLTSSRTRYCAVCRATDRLYRGRKPPRRE